MMYLFTEYLRNLCLRVTHPSKNEVARQDMAQAEEMEA